MKGLRLGKSLDRQLRKQGFILRSGDLGFEGILNYLSHVEARYVSEDTKKSIREQEWYIAPCHVVGLRGEGYAIYYRPEYMR
ncbi:MAG TPA: hypothetical protein VJH95_04965 [Candidatus Nanoarchaeia archaeon]|nr:hypothetical protein [Candidatus Nanoarchaeia archaeon]